MVISHDRWFLDRIATHILAFEGDSKVVWCEGNFRVYEEQKRARLGAAADLPTRIKYRKLHDVRLRHDRVQSDGRRRDNVGNTAETPRRIDAEASLCSSTPTDFLKARRSDHGSRTRSRPKSRPSSQSGRICDEAWAKIDEWEKED